MKSISEAFELGTVNRLVDTRNTESLSWVEHSTFKGVFLKHILKGEDTSGSLSCHLVKINPGCCIDRHVHQGKLEVHEVVSGKGTCSIAGKEIAYAPGSIALIPADTDHKVTAGEEGIFLLAKFSPALL
ncbi:MAG: cupin domain-containing protein [Clostridia bacterium]|nr:cupin domain-containing protein [Clostridia bacterium]